MIRLARVVPGAVLLAAAAATAGAQGPSQPVAQEFESLHFRSIGPATMSGRIADVAVYEANPAIYYVGTAHGGVWKTTSGGATFEPLFQNNGLISIGDVAVSQRNPDLLWVGTGESNNRQSTSYGSGVWKSTDGGRTFQHMGLPNSRHINRVIIDANDDNTVLVAATGPLFGSGGERGVFKTTDGGRTWKRVLFVNDDTGANELLQSPTNPRVMYASTYQRRRNACCFSGGGDGSGIWKSTDAGETWTKLTRNGLPDGPLGRIAIDAFRGNGDILFASIEAATPAQRQTTANTDEEGEGTPAARQGQGQGQQRNPTGVYRSADGGRTWTQVSTNNPRPMYFSKVKIDPKNADIVYMGGVGLQMTVDGGKTFETDAARVTHDDVHAIWVNPANPNHILIGNDGGLAHSYDQSRTWTFIPNLPVGLFYHVSYDMETPFNVCGGMQDNYNWCGPSQTRFSRGIMNSDWHQIQGGDGFVATPDPRDWRIVYTESQNGNMLRRDRITGESKSIRPTALNVVNADTSERYRWFWDTPMILSPHDPGVMFVAAQRVFRSTDRGDSWTAISPDLTTNANRDTIVTMGVRNSDIRLSRNDGISNWPTIVSLAESPRQAGVLYAGTDDGTVSVTRDGGRTWENVTSRLPGFPRGAYVSEVVPSRFEPGTVYITADNHLNNDYEPYIWVSTDFGRTFRSLNGNLRGENVRTLTEDTKNADVLYIGTETGIFLSLDRGRSWRRLQANLPTVRIDELTIHPRDNAMIVATHGRALFILDDLAPIQEHAAAQRATASATLFTPRRTLQWKSKDDRNEEFWGHQYFLGENPPTDAVLYVNVKQPVNDLKLVIADARGRTVRELTASPARRRAGIQTFCWDQRIEPIRTPQIGGAGGGPGGQRGGGGGGGGGQGGQQPRADIPGVPGPAPEPGYRTRDICAEPAADSARAQGAQGGPGGQGGGGFGGGGGATAGPHVVPGTYTVTLMVNGARADSKPLTIVMDPEVRLAGADRERYNAMIVELHEAQQRGTNVSARLTALGRQLRTAAARLDTASNVPAEAKSRFTTLLDEFETVRVKFGVPSAREQGQQGGPGGGGGGGGGFGGGGANVSNALGRVTAVKSGMLGVWEAPSAAVVRQSADARAALTQAITEADALLARVGPAAQALGQYGITLTVPPEQR